MPMAPLDPGRFAAQSSVSWPSATSCSKILNSPSDVPRPRTSWITTI